MKFQMKLSNKLGIGTFEVDDVVIEALDPKVKIRYKEGQVALEDLYGDIVLDVDDITLAQLGWLLKNRSVIYLHLEKTPKESNKMVAIGVERC